MTPLEAAWEAVLGAPDDDQALLVLADALMERGDPHGELIRLQLSGADPSEYLSQHATLLLGDQLRVTAWSPRFERGFLSSVQIASARELEAVFTQPVGRLLRRLDVSSLMTDPIERLVELMAARSPRTITTLCFGRGGVGVEHPGELRVDPITARLTTLESLVLGSWATRFEGASSECLRQLDLNLQQPSQGFGEARMPALTSLSLELPFRRWDLPLPLLAGEVAPKLASLTITGALWPQQLADLSVSALVRGLRRLELAAEAETGWYPTLLETLDAWAHLDEFVLVADRHHPEWVAAVKAALPQAQIRDARLRL